MVIGLQDEVARLFVELLTQRVKDQYRGHEDYHLILDGIRSNFPMVGANVKVQKQDRNGNFYTRTYKVTVKDDIGNFVSSIDDIGGQCVKGEIVKKGFLFTCMECGRNVCRRHVKFVDKDVRKPLCSFGGFLSRDGCYWSYKDDYSSGYSRTDHERLKARKAVLEDVRDITVLEGQIMQAMHEQSMIGSAPESPSSHAGGQARIAGPKRTGALSRFMHGSVHSFDCGNCGKRIWLSNIPCPNCRNVVDLDVDSPLNCPVCGTAITSVDCPECQAKNVL